MIFAAQLQMLVGCKFQIDDDVELILWSANPSAGKNI
jgi:hypothetical protein